MPAPPPPGSKRSPNPSHSSPLSNRLSRRAWLLGTAGLACSRPSSSGDDQRAAQAPASGAEIHLGQQEPSQGLGVAGGHARADSVAQRRVAVVELFTSQGCSSCPPADRTLRALTREGRPDLLAFSFHVDYWNYLGWSDPYSDPAFSARQRRYASRVSGGRVFTPQAIVGGRHSALGSAQGEIEDLVASELGRAAGASVELEWRSGQLRFSAAGAPAGARVTLIVTQNQAANAVQRGENSGSELVHAHVVRALAERELKADLKQGSWVPRLPAGSAPLGTPGTFRAAILVSDKPGQILAAAAVPVI